MTETRGPHRGDTPITVQGRNFTLCYDLNALDLLGQKDIDPAKLGQIRMSNFGLIKELLYAGLQRHHPEMSREDVGAIDWDFDEVAGFLNTAFDRAYGDLVKKKGAKASPSTGASSKSSPSA